MPPILKGMLAVFVALPLWSLSLPTSPFELAAQATSPADWAAVAALTLGPLLTAAALIARHAAFLPAFALECVGLAYVVQASPSPSLARHALLALAFLSGLVLARRDILMPLLAPRRRAWRRAPRIFANAAARLVGDDGAAVPVMVEDASLSGLAVAGAPVRVERFLATRAVGVRLFVELQASGSAEVRRVACRLVRIDRHEAAWRLGLQSDDSEQMHGFLLALGETARATARGSRRLAFGWARSAADRLVFGVWAVAILGAAGAPACGRLETESRRSAGLGDAGGADGRDLVERVLRAPVRLRIVRDVPSALRLTEAGVGEDAACDVTRSVGVKGMTGRLAATSPDGETSIDLRIDGASGVPYLSGFSPEDPGALHRCFSRPDCAVSVTSGELVLEGVAAPVPVDAGRSRVAFVLAPSTLTLTVTLHASTIEDRCDSLVVQSGTSAVVVATSPAPAAPTPSPGASPTPSASPPAPPGALPTAAPAATPASSSPTGAPAPAPSAAPALPFLGTLVMSVKQPPPGDSFDCTTCLRPFGPQPGLPHSFLHCCPRGAPPPQDDVPAEWRDSLDATEAFCDMLDGNPSVTTLGTLIEQMMPRESDLRTAAPPPVSSPLDYAWLAPMPSRAQDGCFVVEDLWANFGVEAASVPGSTGNRRGHLCALPPCMRDVLLGPRTAAVNGVSGASITACARRVDEIAARLCPSYPGAGSWDIGRGCLCYAWSYVALWCLELSKVVGAQGIADFDPFGAQAPEAERAFLTRDLKFRPPE